MTQHETPEQVEREEERRSAIPLILLFLAILAFAAFNDALGIFVFAFAVLFSIGLHEFGHFITAKKAGIKVEQFFIGFGPRLWSFRKGETEYGVKALPLGGFVRIAGMDPTKEIPEEDRERVFQAKKPWQRAIVLAAGSFTHFVLAFVIIVAILLAAGEPVFDRPTTTVGLVATSVDDQGGVVPARAAGLKPRDRIVAIDGVAVTSWDDLTGFVRARPGEEVTITVERDERILVLGPVEIARRTVDGEERGFLGVTARPAYRSVGPIEAVTTSAERVGRGMVDSLKAFRTIFSPSTIGRLLDVAAGNRERSVEDPATVIGISDQAGDLARTGNFELFFYLIAGLNVFIGVANLLPLPPLDGGHLAVLAWEKVTGKAVDMRKLLPLTATVITVFASLFLLLLYLDIVKPLPSIPG